MHGALKLGATRPPTRGGGERRKRERERERKKRERERKREKRRERRKMQLFCSHFCLICARFSHL